MAVPAVSFDLEHDSIVRDEDATVFGEEGSIMEAFPLQKVQAVKSRRSPDKLVRNKPSAGAGLLRPLDKDCYQVLENPGRPQLLGRLLDGMTESLDQSDAKFKYFVAMAENATREVKSCEVLDIRCLLKYTKTEKSLDTYAGADASSNTMILAFMFYAAMQQAGGVSFQATEIANETLSYFELDKFCRDFDIVPKLLTKNEVKAIWQDFIAIHAQTTGGVPLQALNFQQFQDMFVRMALFAYNKVGMKRMILSVTGFFPPPEELVEALCQYCKLHDFNSVQAHIRNTGRETQGALNNRSAGDDNNRARAEIRIDLRAKFLARLASKESQANEKAQAEKEKKRREAAGEEEGVGKKEKTVQYGLWSSLNGKSYKQSTGLFQINRKAKGKSNLPLDILDMLEGKSDSATATPAGGSLDGGNSQTFLASTGNKMAESAQEEELMTYDKATAIAKKVGTRIGILENQYDRELVNVLGKYSRTDPPPEQAGIIDSDAAFLDAGYLAPNTYCSAVINLTNLALDIMHLEVNSTGFGDPNTRVVMSPKPVVSGMQRQIVVKFYSGMEFGSFVGVVTIVATTMSSLNHTIKVPIFYRMDTTCIPRTLCSAKTLDDMCKQYLGRSFKPDDTFERKRLENGVLWLRPQSAATTRRSQQEMRPGSARAVSASQSVLRKTKLKLNSATQRLRPLSDMETQQHNGKDVPHLSDVRAATTAASADRRPISDRSHSSGERPSIKNRPSTAKA